MKMEHVEMPKRRDMESALDISRKFLLKLTDNPKLFETLPKRSVLLRVKKEKVPFDEIVRIGDNLILVEMKEGQKRDIAKLKKTVVRLSSMIRDLEKRHLLSVKK